jgi:hypothetical protein
MVLRWLMREERKPEAITVRKYPTVTMRKRDPAWPWVRPRSSSTAGMRGARTILPVKLKRKINARKRTGPTSVRNPDLRSI